ncbi:MAG: hypothetical protein RIR17_2347, partial [Planctomycetota bacterium]
RKFKKLTPLTTLPRSTSRQGIILAVNILFITTFSAIFVQVLLFFLLVNLGNSDIFLRGLIC